MRDESIGNRLRGIVIAGLAVVAVSGCELPYGVLPEPNVDEADYPTRFEDVPEIQTDGSFMGILQWVADNIEYVNDNDVHGRGEWQQPSETYQRRTGDCEDHAILAAFLLTRAGYDGVMIWVGYDEDSGHVWVEWSGHFYETTSARIRDDVIYDYPLDQRYMTLDEAMSIAIYRSVGR